jgi:hypothetical protein
VSVRAQLAFAAAALCLVLAAASAAADAPSLAVSDAMVTEGDSGTKNALFTVSLSAASAGPVTVDYATADGSATAPDDYVATTGTLTFAPGELSKQVVVAVVGETLDEPHETYSLNLSNAVSATLADPRGAGTVLDNDPQVSLSVDDVSASEGSQSAVFTLSLSRESGKVVTVAYATGDGSAAAPDDYASRSGTIIFLAGETSKTVPVGVVNDALVEPDETFTLALSSAVNATLSDGQGVATIVDDDAVSPPPPPPPGDDPPPPPPPPGEDPPPPPPPGDDQPPPADEEPPVSQPPASEPPVDEPNAAPDCSGVEASPNRLWAPNHKFRLVSLAGATDPEGEALSYEIRSVTQDEPVLRGFDVKRGERSDQLWLRAERRGKGDGRVYRIEYLAWDGRGNACDGTAKVVVPHDRAHPAAPDSGGSFDSFGF